MSEEDEKKPVIEVTEELWEEDTDRADVSELDVSEGEAAPKRIEHTSESLPSSSADTARTEVSSSVATDSEPPPSYSARLLSPALPQLSLSVSEHFSRARRLGTGIWYAGVFLWAYLVVGELVISLGLPEFFGWSAFAGVVVGAFLHGANRIGTAAMRSVAAISVGSVVASIFFLAVVVGSSRQSEYQLVSFTLLTAAVVLILWGIRSARGGLPRRSGPPGINWPRLVLWVLFALQTAFTVAQFLL